MPETRTKTKSITNYHRLGDLKKKNFLTVLEARHPRTKRQQDWFLLSLSPTLCMVSLSLCPHMVFPLRLHLDSLFL